VAECFETSDSQHGHGGVGSAIGDLAARLWHSSNMCPKDQETGKALPVDLPSVNLAADGEQIISATERKITVVSTSGHRSIDATIHLPDNYDANNKYPVVLAVHGLAGSADDIYERGGFEAMRQAGSIIVAPEALRGPVFARSWQSPTENITVLHNGSDARGQKIDDVKGIIDVLAAVKKHYSIDQNNVNLFGFSQGFGVAVAVAATLDKDQAGAVRRVFGAAGTIPSLENGALAGTDVVHYGGEDDWVEPVANWIVGSHGRAPSQDTLMREMKQAKSCPIDSAQMALNGVRMSESDCHDGSHVVELRDPLGEHCVPGQPASLDNTPLTGMTCSAAAGNPLDFESIMQNSVLDQNATYPNLVRRAISLGTRTDLPAGP